MAHYCIATSPTTVLDCSLDSDEEETSCQVKPQSTAPAEEKTPHNVDVIDDLLAKLPPLDEKTNRYIVKPEYLLLFVIRNKDIDTYLKLHRMQLAYRRMREGKVRTMAASKAIYTSLKDVRRVFKKFADFTSGSNDVPTFSHSMGDILLKNFDALTELFNPEKAILFTNASLFGIAVWYFADVLRIIGSMLRMFSLAKASNRNAMEYVNFCINFATAACATLAFCSAAGVPLLVSGLAMGNLAYLSSPIRGALGVLCNLAHLLIFEHNNMESVIDYATDLVSSLMKALLFFVFIFFTSLGGTLGSALTLTLLLLLAAPDVLAVLNSFQGSKKLVEQIKNFFALNFSIDEKTATKGNKNLAQSKWPLQKLLGQIVFSVQFVFDDAVNRLINLKQQQFKREMEEYIAKEMGVDPQKVDFDINGFVDSHVRDGIPNLSKDKEQNKLLQKLLNNVLQDSARAKLRSDLIKRLDALPQQRLKSVIGLTETEYLKVKNRTNFPEASHLLLILSYSATTDAGMQQLQASALSYREILQDDQRRDLLNKLTDCLQPLLECLPEHAQSRVRHLISDKSEKLLQTGLVTARSLKQIYHSGLQKELQNEIFSELNFFLSIYLHNHYHAGKIFTAEDQGKILAMQNKLYDELTPEQQTETKTNKSSYSEAKVQLYYALDTLSQTFLTKYNGSFPDQNLSMLIQSGMSCLSDSDRALLCPNFSVHNQELIPTHNIKAMASYHGDNAELKRMAKLALIYLHDEYRAKTHKRYLRFSKRFSLYNYHQITLRSGHYHRGHPFFGKDLNLADQSFFQETASSTQLRDDCYQIAFETQAAQAFQVDLKSCLKDKKDALELEYNAAKDTLRHKLLQEKIDATTDMLACLKNIKSFLKEQEQHKERLSEHCAKLSQGGTSTSESCPHDVAATYLLDGLQAVIKNSAMLLTQQPKQAEGDCSERVSEPVDPATAIVNWLDDQRKIGHNPKEDGKRYALDIPKLLLELSHKCQASFARQSPPMTHPDSPKPQEQESMLIEIFTSLAEQYQCTARSDRYGNWLTPDLFESLHEQALRLTYKNLERQFCLWEKEIDTLEEEKYWPTSSGCPQRSEVKQLLRYFRDYLKKLKIEQLDENDFCTATTSNDVVNTKMKHTASTTSLDESMHKRREPLLYNYFLMTRVLQPSETVASSTTPVPPTVLLYDRLSPELNFKPLKAGNDSPEITQGAKCAPA